MGFTKNWKDMLACRIILGLLEAGLSTTLLTLPQLDVV